MFFKYLLNMFIADGNELYEFVDRLLLRERPVEVFRILDEEDCKQLLYAKNTMLQKMPKELHSSKSTMEKRQCQIQKIPFPSMFEQNENKPYEYIQSNLQNMKRIINKFPSSQIKAPKDSELMKSQQKDMIQDEGKQINQQMIIQSGGPQPDKISVDKDQLGMSQATSKHQLQNSQRKNPFVANNLNFSDQFANSKSLGTKYTHLNYSENSRNITSIAQSAKFNAFSQSISYPTTVMTGTLIRPNQNVFSKESKLDITDVMKYTLGVSGNKNEKKTVENPFARPPRRRE